MLKVSIISTRINQFCLHWIVVSIDPFLWKACKRIKISTYLTNFPNYCNSVKLLKVSTISTRINQFCHWIIVSIDRFKNQNFYAQTILPNFWRVKKGQSFRVRRTLSLSLSLHWRRMVRVAIQKEEKEERVSGRRRWRKRCRVPTSDGIFSNFARCIRSRWVYYRRRFCREEIII